MTKANSLQRLVDRFIDDPIPKVIGLAFITGWLWFVGSAALNAETLSLRIWLPVILATGLVTAILAIISGIWWTPTHSKGAPPDDQ